MAGDQGDGDCAVSHQSGENLKRLDAESMEELREDDLEHRYQLAVKWRYRIKNRMQMMADTNKEVIMDHIDNLIEACNVYRGRYLQSKNR